MFVTCYCTLQAGLILERILHCEFTKLFAPYPACRSWPLGQSPEARTELGSLWKPSQISKKLSTSLRLGPNGGQRGHSIPVKKSRSKFLFVKSLEKNSTMQRFCQKGFIQVKTLQEFVHRFLKRVLYDESTVDVHLKEVWVFQWCP